MALKVFFLPNKKCPKVRVPIELRFPSHLTFDIKVLMVSCTPIRLKSVVCRFTYAWCLKLDITHVLFICLVRFTPQLVNNEWYQGASVLVLLAYEEKFSNNISTTKIWCLFVSQVPVLSSLLVSFFFKYLSDK